MDQSPRFPLPSGFEFLELPEIEGPPPKVRVAPISTVFAWRPIPRTLVEAFPVSEGYRYAAGRIRSDGSTEVVDGAAPLRGWRALFAALVTPDRVGWCIILGLAAWAVRWAWLAPKVGS